VTGVFGVSGAGKTSLLETVAGIRKQASGIIKFGNRTWFDSENNIYEPTHRRNIGYVPQDSLLFPHKNVRQNLLAGSGRAQKNQQPVDDLFDQVTMLLKIQNLLDRDVSTLSGGERQRVALGRALCSGPELLLLDEPLASLDITLRYHILPFLHRIKQEFNIPILLVSHDPIEVQALCNDLLVLDKGQIIAQGSPRNVLTNPDVFPMADKQGFQNIFPARVLRHEDNTSYLSMGENSSGVEIVTPRIDKNIGEQVLVSIPAYDIILGNNKPKGLSARNIISAEISDIQQSGVLILVTVNLGENIPELVVEITDNSRREMGLEPGKSIYLIIKTASWQIYGEE